MSKSVVAASIFTAFLRIAAADTLDFEKPAYRAGQKLDGQDGWDFNPNGKHSRSGDFRIHRSHGHHGNQFLRAHTHGYTQYSREVESQSDTAELRWRWKAPSGRARLCFGPSDSLEPGKSNWNTFRVKVCFNDVDFEHHPPHGHHARCGKRHKNRYDGHRHGDSHGGEWIYMRLSLEIAAGRYSLFRDEGETRDDEDTLVSNGSINGSGPISRIFLKAGGRSPYVDMDDVEWGGVGEPPPPPLILIITSPSQDTLVNRTPIAVAYTVNGIPFNRQTALVEGPNQVIIDTVDAFGRRAVDTVNITLDTQPPFVQITSPAPGFVTNQTAISVAWTVDGITQTVQTTENLTQEGTNTITRTAMDAAGNIGSASIQVIRDTEAPVVVITSPADGFTTDQASVQVAWTVDGVGQTSQLTENLAVGTNTITRSVTDAAGNTGTASIMVTRTSAPGRPPRVCGTASPQSGGAPLIVTFTGEAKSFGSSLQYHKWDFDGDGTFDTIIAVSADPVNPEQFGPSNGFSQVVHTYDVPGVYAAKLTVMDEQGRESEADARTTLVTVGPSGAPTVAIVGPQNCSFTNQTVIQVFWTIDGVEQTVQTEETLTEGENFITRSFTDGTGFTATATILVTLDTQPPMVEIQSPEDGGIVHQDPILVQWTVDGVPRSTEYFLGVGEREYAFVYVDAYDEAGNYGWDGHTVLLDFPPKVVIVSPSEGAVVSSPVEVHYTVDGEQRSAFYDLTPGENEIIVTAADSGGNVGADTLHVVFDDTSPTWPPDSSLTATNIRASSLTLNWTAASDALGIGRYRVYRNDGLIATVPGAQQTYNAVGLLMDTTYDFRIQALDLAGNPTVGDPTLTVRTGNQLPPDPSTIAPPLPQGVATILSASTSFLYDEENNTQTGVGDSALIPELISVLRGWAVDVAGSPAPGVTVSVLNHSEFGSTVTRADGGFELAVNGGGKLVISYESKGYLPLQRNAFPRWQDFAVMDTVVLTRLDTTVTLVNLSGVQPMQVVRASVVSDDDGTRQATLLIPTGTSASMVMPDGRLQTLGAMHVRATEYTVGERGPQAMPGVLPPTSIYTYAVEFSVDEAQAQGSSEVRFNAPVWSYVENFVGIPVGYAVPQAFYEKQKGQWIPDDDGRVISIASITDGIADLVVDTTGTVATQDALDSLGITSDERQSLASLYVPGQTLLRVPIRRFSPRDFNYPGDEPPDPDEEPPEEEDPDNCSDSQSGSIIDCQNQALGESVDFPGLPTLNYRSDRVPALRWNFLGIPLTGPDIPPDLVDVQLKLSIAGRSFQGMGFPFPNLRVPFAWDGRDAYGRLVYGRQRYTYMILYGFEQEYQQPVNDLRRTFGATSGLSYPNTTPTRPRIYRGRDYSGYLGVADVADLGRGWSLENHHFYDPIAGVLHQGDGQNRGVNALGGAVYSVAGKVAFEEGGPPPLVEGVPALEVILGSSDGIDMGPDGSLYIAKSDAGRILKVGRNGILATAVMGRPWTDVKADADGNLYLVESGNHRVWKRAADGALTVVAGGGEAGFDGDGDLAINAKLNSPANVALGLDGSLFIADAGNNRVRKVTPDGLIQTAVGTGNVSYNGDSIPARQANLSVAHVAVGPDGSLYIADPFNFRIRRVDLGGRISTIGGNGVGGEPSGDDGDALEASIMPTRVELATTQKGGVRIFLYDEQVNTIRMIGEDGMIHPYIGGFTGFGASFAGDGTSTRRLRIPNFRDMAVDADGTLYLNSTPLVGRPGGSPAPPPTASVSVQDDYLTTQVMKFVGVFPRFTNKAILIPSTDKSEIFVFSPQGRHLKTVNGFTGKELLNFSYDATGFLIAVTDAYGNVTEIHRGPDGLPTAIRNPYGQTLNLDTDPDGNLLRIILPSNEVHEFEYDGSLITRHITPRNQVHVFTYDSLGRLFKDEDPAGGFKTVEKTATSGGGWITSVSTALGRTDLYEMLFPSDLGVLKRNTDPAGLVMETGFGADGAVTTVVPDGTRTTMQTGPDPYFRLLEQRSASTEIRLPGGLVHVSVEAMVASFTDPQDPFSGSFFSSTVKVNNRLSTTNYDNSPRQWFFEFPQGRFTSSRIDSLGKIIERIIPGLENVAYAYDSRGRLATITQGSGIDARSTVFAYNPSGYLSSIQDAENRTFVFEYDLAGRVTKETLPDGREINYTYDADGNVSSITPPSRPPHEFEYTPVDLEGRYNPPALGAGTFDTRYAYNLDRQLLDIDRPDAVQVHYDYDAGGRVSSIQMPGGNFTFAYNSTTGKLETLGSPYGVNLAYSYDGFLPTSTIWSGAIGGSVSVGYNNDFWVTSQSVNGSDAVSFSYDNDGLLTQAGDLGLTRDSQNGRLTGSSTGVVSDALTYSAFGEVQEYSASISSSPAYQCVYERDKLGRITKKTETVEGTTHIFEYEYDLTGRLRQVKRDALVTAIYAYDANGNRLSKMDGGGTIAGNYDDQDRLTQYGSAMYTYNSNGDLESKTEAGQTTTYAYDAFGNLHRVDLPGGIQIEYVIDGQNRRVGKKVNGTVVQGFLYQNQLNPVAELDGSGNVVARFVYSSKSNVPDLVVKGGVTYRIISDHLGNPRLVVNISDGSVVQRMAFDEFGNALEDSNPGFQPFGFAGGLHDSHTGLIRFGARDYSALESRWTTKDPKKFRAKDVNLYSYVGNNPLNYIDPTGLDWQYSQCNGELTHIDNETGGETPVGTGYSGTGAGLNNQSMQNESHVGPIPQGGWNIGSPLNSPGQKGYPKLPLTPDPGVTDRTGFQIHGDNPCGCQSASTGCIVLPKNVREQINESDDKRLNVVDCTDY